MRFVAFTLARVSHWCLVRPGGDVRRRGQDRRADRSLRAYEQNSGNGSVEARRWRPTNSATRSTACRSRSSPPTIRTSPISARHRAALVRSRRGRRRHRSGQFGGRLRRARDRQDRQQGRAADQRRLGRFHRQGVRAQQSGALGLRHLRDRRRHRRGHAAARQDLVLHHRRLRVRPGASGRRHAFIEKNGGKVLGSVPHPLGTTDYSSFMLQAQASSAEVVALANGGDDAINAVKTAREFGITEKQKVVPFGLEFAAGDPLDEPAAGARHDVCVAVVTRPTTRPRCSSPSSWSAARPRPRLPGRHLFGGAQLS